MSILQWYLLKEWLKALLVSFAVTNALVLFISFSEDAKYGKWALGLEGTLLYAASSLVSLAAVLLPISAFMASLMALRAMNNKKELVAVHSSGISSFALCRPLWIAALLLSLLLLGLNASYGPRMLEILKSFSRGSGQFQEKSSFKLAFINEGRRIWLIEKIKPSQGTASGVFVHQYDPQGHEASRVYAQKAVFEPELGHWTLHKGQEIRFESQRKSVSSFEKFEKRDYPAFTQKPENFKLANKNPAFLNLLELRTLFHTLPTQTKNDSRYQSRYQGLLADPFSCLALVAIAISLGSAPSAPSNPKILKALKIPAALLGFYAVLYLGKGLCAQGVLPPILGLWGPIIISTAIPIYCMQGRG